MGGDQSRSKTAMVGFNGRVEGFLFRHHGSECVRRHQTGVEKWAHNLLDDGGAVVVEQAETGTLIVRLVTSGKIVWKRIMPMVKEMYPNAIKPMVGGFHLVCEPRGRFIAIRRDVFGVRPNSKTLYSHKYIEQRSPPRLSGRFFSRLCQKTVQRLFVTL